MWNFNLLKLEKKKKKALTNCESHGNLIAFQTFQGIKNKNKKLWSFKV